MKNLFLLILIASTWPRLYSQNASQIAEQVKRGQVLQARQTLATLTGIEPDYRLFLEGFLTSSGDSARYFYTRLAQNHPQSPFADDALFRLSQMRFAQGLYKAAQQGFRHITTAYPQSSLLQESAYWSGVCFQNMNRPDSARACFQEAVQRFPHNDISQLARLELNPDQENSTPAQPPMQIPEYTHSVQVGAFTHQPNALLRKSFFENKGYRVLMRSKTVDGRKFYLVWVGSYASRQEARDQGERLKKEFGVNYTLVSEKH